MSAEIECDVYKSPKKTDYYLYVVASEGLERVPELLLKQLGEVEKALSFTLNADRTLAREDPVLVMNNLQAQGYHLQMPPADERTRV